MKIICDHIENILIGFIGRPVLTLIKWLRWIFLITGLFFNMINIYNPITQQNIGRFTILPAIIGILLFSVGITVKRYDERIRQK